jgi:hypothetical protein
MNVVLINLLLTNNINVNAYKTDFYKKVIANA